MYYGKKWTSKKVKNQQTSHSSELTNKDYKQKCYSFDRIYVDVYRIDMLHCVRVHNPELDLLQDGVNILVI